MRSALGLTEDDWEYLRDRMREAARTTPVTRVEEHRDGTLAYRIVMDILGRNGKTAAVTTGWFQEPGEPPRLVTAYVSGRRRTQ